MMDLLYWDKIPGIRVGPTLKQYYGQYLWKMTIRAKAGRLIQEPIDSDLGALLQSRQNSAKRYNISGWWGTKKDDLIDVDLDLLSAVRQMKNDSTLHVKIRVEEPFIQFYASTETELKKIANRLSHFNAITHIHGPADRESQNLLESGVIIRKTPIEYKYKVVCRDGKYSSETKYQVLNYLDGLGDVVKVNKGARVMLGSKYDHCWGVYFYTNDTSILTFISLIEPKLISNIHEMVVLPNK